MARHAVVHIGRALALRHPARTRNRAMDLIGLARTHLLAWEPEHSAQLVTEALPLIDRRQPGRLGRRVADWHREALDFASLPFMRQARHAVVRQARHALRELTRALGDHSTPRS